MIYELCLRVTSMNLVADFFETYIAEHAAGGLGLCGARHDHVARQVVRERLELRTQCLVQLHASHPPAHVGTTGPHTTTDSARGRGRLSGLPYSCSSSNYSSCAGGRAQRSRARRGADADAGTRARDSVGGGAEARLSQHLTGQVAEEGCRGTRSARLLPVLHSVGHVERAALGHVGHDAPVTVRLMYLQEVLRTPKVILSMKNDQ